MARSSDALGAPTPPERYPEEALLEVYKLEWELIDIRRKQLRNTWQQLVLRDRADEEERAFFREQARVLSEQARAQAAKARADAIKYAEEHAEDILRQRGLTATSGPLPAEKENNYKSQKSVTLGVSRKKSKEGVGENDDDFGLTGEALNGVPSRGRSQPKPKPKEKSVGSTAPSKRSRKEPKLVDEVPVDYGMDSPVPALDDDNDLLNLLSQDKASDDSDMDHEPSMASLILPVASPARARPARHGSRALTPTPQKRKRKPAAAQDEDFDFSRKGELKRVALEARNQIEEEPEPTAVTPKKALKRRKELERERLERLNGAASMNQGNAGRGGQSLMEEVASSRAAKIKQTAKTASSTNRAGTAAVHKSLSAIDVDSALTGDDSAGDGAPALVDQLKNKNLAKRSRNGGRGEDSYTNGGDSTFSGVTMRSKKSAQGKAGGRSVANGTLKDKQSRSKRPSSADITKAQQGQRRTQGNDANNESDGDSSDDVGISKPPVNRPKKSGKDKRSKMDEVALALRKAEMLTRISRMQQEVATPKVSKKKKVAKKTTASVLAAKRSELKQTLSAGSAGTGRVDGPETIEQRSAADSRATAAAAQPKESTPPPEKLQFLQFTKGLSKSPMPLNLRSKLKSPVLASPMRKRPRAAGAVRQEPEEDVGMPSPAYSYGNSVSPRESIADLTRAVTSASTSRQVAVGITTRSKKKKTATAPKANRFGVPSGLISSTGGSSTGGANTTPSGGFSMFDAFVNTSDAPIPRLKTTGGGDMSPVV